MGIYGGQNDATKHSWLGMVNIPPIKMVSWLVDGLWLLKNRMFVRTDLNGYSDGARLMIGCGMIRTSLMTIGMISMHDLGILLNWPVSCNYPMFDVHHTVRIWLKKSSSRMVSFQTNFPLVEDETYILGAQSIFFSMLIAEWQRISKLDMRRQSLSGWWFGTFFIFPYIGNNMIPIDFHIFQRGSNHQPVIYRWFFHANAKLVRGFPS